MPVHPLCGHRGGPNPRSTASAPQVAYLGAALRPGGGPWAAQCTGACDSGWWLGCRQSGPGGVWMTGARGMARGNRGAFNWPALVGQCKPPRWHQMPGIFLGPSLLPVVAETAAQNNTTVWHKSGQLALGLCVPKPGAKCLNAPRAAHALWRGPSFWHGTCNMHTKLGGHARTMVGSVAWPQWFCQWATDGLLATQGGQGPASHRPSRVRPPGACSGQV